jgi:hypothetical protein
VTGPIATKKFQTKPFGMLVELRSTGMQTVFPPSIHEFGEPITWDQSDPQPAEIEPQELLECVQRLADAVKVELGIKPASPKRSAKPKSPRRRGPAAVQTGDVPDQSGDSDGQFYEGSRNDSLTSLAGKLRYWGAELPEIETLLLKENQQRCVPPLED